jgi:hypothetical protein
MVAAVAAGLALNVQRGETHKPITSKYTYNEDVFPILRDRCGRCHIQDGVAPMSLMTYRDAFPWGESVRAEVIAGHMPPWHAQEGANRFKNQPTITAAELDKILVWVSGSYPQGNLQNVPPRVVLQHDWPIGKPDLVLPLSEVTLDPDTSEITREFNVRPETTDTRWLRAVDLLPGTPSVVRDATISIKGKSAAGATQIAAADMLAAWVPGEDPVEAERGAFRLPAGAELTVRVHYKKTYSYGGREMKDKSTVGLYFAPAPSNEIRRFGLASAPVKMASNPVTFSRTVDEDLQALAFSPDPSLSNVGLQVDAVSASGVRTPVIRLAVRPNWARRYWFDQPLALPRGTRIEVVAVVNGADRLLPPAGTPLPSQVLDGSPVRVMLDVVSAGPRPAAH